MPPPYRVQTGSRTFPVNVRQIKKCKYLQKSVDSVVGMFFTEVAGGD
jgi:hypothetical protein